MSAPWCPLPLQQRIPLAQGDHAPFLKPHFLGQVTLAAQDVPGFRARVPDPQVVRRTLEEDAAGAHPRRLGRALRNLRPGASGSPTSP